MAEIIGTNQTTPDKATYPSTLLTGADESYGLRIKYGASAPADQKAIEVRDSGGTVRWSVGKTSVDFFGCVVGAIHSIGSQAAGLDGHRNPACLRLPSASATTDSTAVTRVWGGTGAPSSTTVGGAAAVGDLYFRRDTPSTANQRLYICTTAGTPGTWSGIA